MTNKRKTIISAFTITIVILAAVGAIAISQYSRSVRTPEIALYEALAGDPIELGAARLAFDDFDAMQMGTLDSHALPWKLVTTALLLHQPDKRAALDMASLDRLLQSFGFLRPEAIANWPSALETPEFRMPLGINSTTLRPLPFGFELEIANLSCAACHAAPLYDERGNPLKTVWLGAPNTSIDLESYTTAVYESLKHALTLPDQELLDAIATVFPDTSTAELRMLKLVAIPQARRRCEQLASSGDRPMPFSNGGPGFTNGVAAMKQQLGLLPADSRHSENGLTAIPALGATWMRSSLLYDGVYAVPGKARSREIATHDADDEHIAGLAAITSYFTISTMGLEPLEAGRLIHRTRDVFAFLKASGTPPYPGTIDQEMATAGNAIYNERCASCHGDYRQTEERMMLVRFPNRLVPQEDMNTDPTRWRVFGTRLVEHVNNSPMNKNVIAENTGGYIAPPLTGVWLRAPYLHNGSVPTLSQLMNPTERPERFMVGGHRLDLAALGIDGKTDADGVYRYPAGYVPWSVPQVYDTRLPGQSNRGHEREFADFEPQQKQELLEFLKML